MSNDHASSELWQYGMPRVAKGPDRLYERAAHAVPGALHDAIGNAVMDVVARGKESWHRQDGVGIPRYTPEPPLTIEITDISKVARGSMHYDMAGVVRYHFARHGIDLLDCELSTPSVMDATSYEVRLNVSEGEHTKMKPAAEAQVAAVAVGATVRGRGRHGK